MIHLVLSMFVFIAVCGWLGSKEMDDLSNKLIGIVVTLAAVVFLLIIGGGVLTLFIYCASH